MSNQAENNKYTKSITVRTDLSNKAEDSKSAEIFDEGEQKEGWKQHNEPLYS